MTDRTTTGSRTRAASHTPQIQALPRRLRYPILTGEVFAPLLKILTPLRPLCTPLLSMLRLRRQVTQTSLQCLPLPTTHRPT